MNVAAHRSITEEKRVVPLDDAGAASSNPSADSSLYSDQQLVEGSDRSIGNNSARQVNVLSEVNRIEALDPSASPLLSGRPSLRLTQDGPLHTYTIPETSGSAASIDMSRPVTPDDVILLLRAARRRLREGMFVNQLSMAGNSKNDGMSSFSNLLGHNEATDRIVRSRVRQLYIGYQPEYVELTTSERIETIIHVSAITRVSADLNVLMEISEFRNFATQPRRRSSVKSSFLPILPSPKGPEVLNRRCCLLIESGTSTRLCLLFATEKDRRYAQFHLLVECLAIQLRYRGLESEFGRLCDQSSLAITMRQSE